MFLKKNIDKIFKQKPAIPQTAISPNIQNVTSTKVGKPKEKSSITQVFQGNNNNSENKDEKKELIFYFKFKKNSYIF